MRIVQVMAGAVNGGAELFFERLNIALSQRDCTVLPIIRADAARAARLAQAGLRPLELRFGRMLDVFTGPRLARRVQEFAPEIVVAWMNRAASFAPRGRWTLVGRLGGYYDLRYYRRCDHLVANTIGLVDWIRGQGVAAGRVHHLPNFVADLGGAVPERLGVPAGVPLLLGLGRLHRNKGFDTLIQALPQLAGAHAVIAGEGPERAALRDLARRLGVANRVHLPGWRQDVAALLAGCDVFVCSSRQEALGNMVIEAFSARRPVVAVAVGGPAELIRSGENGLLVPPEDTVALAGAIGCVLGAPALAARLAAGARADFEAEHAEAPVLARWLAFFQQMRRSA